MNTTIIRPVGDEFLVDNFDELEEIRVHLNLHGAEAVALITMISKVDQAELDPICQNIAQTIIKRLSDKLLGGETCSLSR